jgi:hypothetical protein
MKSPFQIWGTADFACAANQTHAPWWGGQSSARPHDTSLIRGERLPVSIALSF